LLLEVIISWEILPPAGSRKATADSPHFLEGRSFKTTFLGPIMTLHNIALMDYTKNSLSHTVRAEQKEEGKEARQHQPTTSKVSSFSLSPHP
jgi:hypothetical protein